MPARRGALAPTNQPARRRSVMRMQGVKLLDPRHGPAKRVVVVPRGGRIRRPKAASSSRISARRTSPGAPFGPSCDRCRSAAAAAGSCSARSRACRIDGRCRGGHRTLWNAIRARPCRRSYPSRAVSAQLSEPGRVGPIFFREDDIDTQSHYTAPHGPRVRVLTAQPSDDLMPP